MEKGKETTIRKHSKEIILDLMWKKGINFHYFRITFLHYIKSAMKRTKETHSSENLSSVQTASQKLKQHIWVTIIIFFINISFHLWKAKSNYKQWKVRKRAHLLFVAHVHLVCVSVDCWESWHQNASPSHTHSVPTDDYALPPCPLSAPCCCGIQSPVWLLWMLYGLFHLMAFSQICSSVKYSTIS